MNNMWSKIIIGLVLALLAAPSVALYVILFVRDIRVEMRTGKMVRTVKRIVAQNVPLGVRQEQAMEYLRSPTLHDVLRAYDLETPSWSIDTLSHEGRNMAAWGAQWERRAENDTVIAATFRWLGDHDPGSESLKIRIIVDQHDRVTGHEVEWYIVARYF